MQLIKNWEELAQVPPNDKFKIIVNSKFGCGWIVPICDEPSEDINVFICNCTNEDDYFENHCYLHTHTFYSGWYQNSTKTLQEYGFDIEIDNWDKEVNDCE